MAGNSILKAFGRRVRELRLERGYSQEPFADAIGLHRTYIGAIERGEQNVSLNHIARIAKAAALTTDVVALASRFKVSPAAMGFRLKGLQIA
jgi:transcriptional regulator with XRE-family HTH domain